MRLTVKTYYFQRGLLYCFNSPLTIRRQLTVIDVQTFYSKSPCNMGPQTNREL